MHKFSFYLTVIQMNALHVGNTATMFVCIKENHYKDDC